MKNVKGTLKGSDVYCFLKRSYFRCRVAVVPKRVYAVLSYWKRYRKYLNVNHPKTFDEKLWWLKFNYHNPLQTQCADKWWVREYVRDCGLEDILIPAYGYYRSFDEIDFSEIPDDEFFLKCTHLSGGNMIVQKETFDKKIMSKQFGQWLKFNTYYYGYEWPYKNMIPGIIAEKVLHTSDSNGLLDYKFMCFEGEPKLLFLDIGVCNTDGSHAEEYNRNIYDMDFVLQDIWETRQHSSNEIKRPENFDKMIECARMLSKPFPHCRVDLYNVNGKIYFGEITFYHGSGYNKIRPHEADLMMGSWIDINRHMNVYVEHSNLFDNERCVCLNRKG